MNIQVVGNVIISGIDLLLDASGVVTGDIECFELTFYIWAWLAWTVDRRVRCLVKVKSSAWVLVDRGQSLASESGRVADRQVLLRIKLLQDGALNKVLILLTLVLGYGLG